MKRLCDQSSEARQFSEGDQVLALLPIVWPPFQATFAGPFTELLLQTVRKSNQLCHVKNDVVIYRNTLSHINALFKRLYDGNLTSNLAKCEFVKATVTYLGKSGS